MACERNDCQLQLDGVVGGLEILGTQLEATLDSHNQYCSQVSEFTTNNLEIYDLIFNT